MAPWSGGQWWTKRWPVRKREGREGRGGRGRKGNMSGKEEKGPSTEARYAGGKW